MKKYSAISTLCGVFFASAPIATMALASDNPPNKAQITVNNQTSQAVTFEYVNDKNKPKASITVLGLSQGVLVIKKVNEANFVGACFAPNSGQKHCQQSLLSNSQRGMNAIGAGVTACSSSGVAPNLVLSRELCPGG